MELYILGNIWCLTYHKISYQKMSAYAQTDVFCRVISEQTWSDALLLKLLTDFQLMHNPILPEYISIGYSRI